MTNMKEIYDFAVKWCDLFRDLNSNHKQVFDQNMADECAALGFEMDCGHAFFDKYGQASHNPEALEKIIEEVTDIPLLGSAIYAQWNNIQHETNTSAEKLDAQDLAWFMLALSRLVVLCREDLNIFQGAPKNVRIVSNNIAYGLSPWADEEVEQHLTINDEGWVWFSAYNYGRGSEGYEKARSKHYKIDKATAEKLLGVIATYFGNGYTEIFATDIGDWVMELTNTNGITFSYRGSLCADLYLKGSDLSDLVRDTLGMDDLLVFDGNSKPDRINKITVDYHRVNKIKPGQKPKDAKWKFVTWDYSERLVIDRATETLEYIQNIGSGCKVTRKYEMEDAIASLLDNFDAEELFTQIEGNFDDVIETPNETKDYTITIEYKKNPIRTITGSFDKLGLPDDFEDFADTVFDFIRFYGLGDILNPSVYGKMKRRQSDYIFCSVRFDEGYKTYYYLTDDDSIEVGDFVIVPAGKDNHEAVVEVVYIEYFDEEHVPLPVEKTKSIIRKCSDEVFDLTEE